MTTQSAPSSVDAFVQLIEYRTNQGDEVAAIIARWVDTIGAARTARWYVTCADRDDPRQFVQMVEFPSHAAAMANSDHPATAEFAVALRKICDGDITFRNLDVVDTSALA